MSVTTKIHGRFIVRPPEDTSPSAAADAVDMIADMFRESLRGVAAEAGRVGATIDWSTLEVDTGRLLGDTFTFARPEPEKALLFKLQVEGTL